MFFSGLASSGSYVASTIDMSKAIDVCNKLCKVKHKGNFNKTIFCYRGLKDTKYLAKINRYMQYNVFPLV